MIRSGKVVGVRDEEKIEGGESEFVQEEEEKKN